MLLIILLFLLSNITMIITAVILKNRQLFIVKPRFTIVSVDHFFVKTVHRYRQNGFSIFMFTDDISEKDRVIKETNYRVTIDRHLFGFKRREEWYQQSETNDREGWIKIPDGTSSERDKFALTRVFDAWLIEQSYTNSVLENDSDN